MQPRSKCSVFAALVVVSGAGGVLSACLGEPDVALPPPTGTDTTAPPPLVRPRPSPAATSAAEPPLLAGLIIEGAARSVYPPFESGKNHYALHPTSTDQLSVAATALHPAHWISVGGRDWRQGSASEDLSALPPGEDLVVSVANRLGELNHYVLHYLPQLFPVLQISRRETSVTDELLFIVAKHRTPIDGATSFASVVDNEGVPHQLRRIDGNVFDFQRQVDGRLSYTLRTGVNAYGIPTWDPFLLDGLLGQPEPVAAVGLPHTDGHDFLVTDEGNYLFISYDNVVRDMSAYGLSTQQNVGDSVIQERTPSGDVVWQWRSWGHLDFADCPRASELPADWAHLNSLWLTDDDAVIGSFRHCGQILKIRRGTGEVVWRLGGADSSFAITGDPFGEFCGQHSASETPGGGILLFDNGNYCHGDRETEFGQFSRVVEYSLDESSGQASLVWDHSLGGTYTEFARAQGGVQHLPNGHVVIAWGWGPSTSVTELDADRNEIFRMEILDGGDLRTTYRALRYPGFQVVVDPLLPELPK